MVATSVNCLNKLPMRSSYYVQHLLQMTAIITTTVLWVAIDHSDETTDVSSNEHAVVVIRWVDDMLDTHEDFIGLYKLETIEASSIVSMFRDILQRRNLTTGKIRGQYYDGASAMSGKKTGVSTQLQELKPRAVYTHCYEHALNLAASDALKGPKPMKNALETTHEATKLIKYSPRRDNAFKTINGEMSPGSPGIRVLCPTRWTVKADALASILKNYPALQETWRVAADLIEDSETIARINGVATQIQKFSFIFGAMLGEKILRPTDQLSKTLQKVEFSAADEQEAAKMTIQSLQAMCSKETFEDFWSDLTTFAAEHDVEEAAPPPKTESSKEVRTSRSSTP